MTKPELDPRYPGSHEDIGTSAANYPKWLDPDEILVIHTVDGRVFVRAAVNLLNGECDDCRGKSVTFAEVLGFEVRKVTR